jgi:predicted nuclease with TOPRIM domain
VDENEACQTTLKRQIAQLESEKQGLIDKVETLKKRVDELEAENQRLKAKI